MKTTDASKVIAERDTLLLELNKAIKNNRMRNIELDALHYVWCDGGCDGGVHRFGEHPPLTAEIVAAAKRNAERLERWFVNAAGRADDTGTVDARKPLWELARDDIKEAEASTSKRKPMTELKQSR